MSYIKQCPLCLYDEAAPFSPNTDSNQCGRCGHIYPKATLSFANSNPCNPFELTGNIIVPLISVDNNGVIRVDGKKTKNSKKIGKAIKSFAKQLTVK